MYSSMDEDEGYDESSVVSSMLWVRNLRRYIKSDPGISSEAMMGIRYIIAYRLLMQKQSDILLDADDLDAMWLCLRENCVVGYEDFCQIASLCTEQIGSKCRRFFNPSNFMKFEKDESGRISILSFYLYAMRTVSLTQARIDMSELDEDSDGFLQPHLRDMPAAFVQMYCHIAAHKFFFFCDPSRRGKACIKKILLSNCLQELMELHQENDGEGDTDQNDNWFSVASAQHTFLDLDKDTNGTLGKDELRAYAEGSLTDIFIERENKDTPEGLTYLFRCLDLHGRGYLTAADIHILFRYVREKWIQVGNYELCTEDVRDEIWDMVRPADPLRITLSDMLACKQGGTIASILIDVRGFWAHDNRENLLQEDEEPLDIDMTRN
ncbi:Calcium-binding EF-hand [Cynara cardunculus var. scolymus]|uniref:Calcium-binding EF-hand n=1 Tax=Cynara cardunculus var. scolymus TaxID=59895 RepID=A0A118JX75_CYNCS|nr:Calcium-binding EF-hand [Cynara cardunculus var. scolymus]